MGEVMGGWMGVGVVTDKSTGAGNGNSDDYFFLSCGMVPDDEKGCTDTASNECLYVAVGRRIEGDRRQAGRSIGVAEGAHG